MTFTALIASVSHIMVDSAILLVCCDYLPLSIVVATVFSLVSAQFVNKMSSKAVEYVTGAILLIFGLSMTFINNLDQWFS